MTADDEAFSDLKASLETLQAECAGHPLAIAVGEQLRLKPLRATLEHPDLV